MVSKTEQDDVVTHWSIPCLTSDKQGVDRNPIQQLVEPSQVAPIVDSHDRRSVFLDSGKEVRVVRNRADVAEGQAALIQPRLRGRSAVPGGEVRCLRWVGHCPLSNPTTVLESLRGAFHFVSEDQGQRQKGLRTPQLGAVHAVLAYWTTAPSLPATVVMPTGTGKTDTMLALFAAARPDRLMVIVPSDALRSQLAARFESFGVLQRLGVVSQAALRPVVGQVMHAFSSPEAARGFATQCNVIVATPQALNASSGEARTALIDLCSHLFVDEAHHVAAASWRQLREEFSGKPVVQFTATPFREDGKRLGGRMIYSFPLREAQRQGYFSRINYQSIADFSAPDRTIAAKATEALRADLEAGRDHILMARVNRISRADDVLAIYREEAADLQPLLIHSRSSASARRVALEAIHSRQSRIIVCVDMLGEGFDLPALKIAAIHDAHRSLGVTLQFVGRFARVADESIGEATVVVGRPDSDYDDNLRKLHAEDADWNLIIRNLSEAAIGQEEEVSEFEGAFNSLPEDLSLANILPKMSTVVYRTGAGIWKPEAITTVFPEESLLTFPIPVNARDRVAWFVTEIATQVPWGDIRAIQDLAHHLYVLYWDSDRQLLYINSSSKGMHEELAKAVCGDAASRITGAGIYRAMANVDRLVPTNVGLLDIHNRSRRFSMHVGADVVEGFPVAEAQTKTKTNIFAFGFENGNRVSVGGSLKGRVWSYRVAPSLKHWVDWCDHVGGKLVDTSIDIDEIMGSFIVPTPLEGRPSLIPLALEWPWELFANLSEELRIEQGGASVPIVDAELVITSFADDGAIPFDVVTDAGRTKYEAVIADGKVEYRAVAHEAVVTNRTGRVPLSAWLTKIGLTIHFENETTLTPNDLLMRVVRELSPFDRGRIAELDWSGVDIRKESQGQSKDAGSVQARAIQHVRGLAAWDLVIDDDGAGEVADIVAIRVDGNSLHIMLVHCKYSSGPTPGHRVGDLYEVCGQAQKSVRWEHNPSLLLRNLARRERDRLRAGRKSGFEVGSAAAFYQVEQNVRRLRPRFSMMIVQPGLSKSLVSEAQLQLLAAAEVFISETANGSLTVLCSP